MGIVAWLLLPTRIRKMPQQINSDKGFVLIMVLGFICISALFLYVGLEAISGCLKANSCLQEMHTVQDTEKTIKETLWLEAIEAIRNDTFQLKLNDNNGNELLNWVLPADVVCNELGFSRLSAPLFSRQWYKTHEPSKAIVSHPLYQKRGHIVTQKFNTKFSKKNYPKVYNSQFEIAFKVMPSTEFAFISESAFSFSPENSTIGLIIEGDAFVPSYYEKASGASIEFQNLFCKSYVKDPALKEVKTTIKDQLWANHKFVFSYGMHPSSCLLPEGWDGLYESQIYCKHNKAKVIHFDGKALDYTYPGIEVRVFNGGAERVVIDLAQAHGNHYPKVLYIYCTTEDSRNVGVVIKGAKQYNADGPSCIISNGRIWLWGDHLGKPIIIGSTHGSWTLMDDSWKEGEANTRPLNLTWKGYLTSPTGIGFFSSPQLSGKDSRLTLQGTLLIGGRLLGNLETIRITHSSEVAESLADVSEKLVMPVAIKSISQ